MNKAITATDLHRIFTMYSIPPTQEFVAAAGADYGCVLAWELNKQASSCLIQYGNNG